MNRAWIVLLAAALAGCATSPEITAWNMARDVNTPAAYQDFLKRHPDSDHADEARERVGKSRTERILAAVTVAECVRGAKESGDPKVAGELADRACKAAREETSVEDLYEFLVQFRGHAGVPEIRSRVEDLEFRAASGAEAPEPLEYFLMRHPASRRSEEARKQLEDRRYRQAKEWGSPFGYRAFLRRFPESPRAAEFRALAGADSPHRATPETRAAVLKAVDGSPALKRAACALSLSSRVRKGGEDADSFRRILYDLEKTPADGALPEACAAVKAGVRPDADGTLEEALRRMERLEAQRKSLTDSWVVYGQRGELARAAVSASGKVADELEAAELSEDVLGKGPLGGLDVGTEKASVSARKAIDRFQAAEKSIGRERTEVGRMLLELDGEYRPLRQYVGGSLVAE